MKYRDPYRHYRRQARRGWRGRRDGYPIMFIGTGEPLSLIAAAALGRLLYRHRSAFAPFAITSAAFIAAEMIHRHHPRYWLAVAGVTAAVTILAGIPHRLLWASPAGRFTATGLTRVCEACAATPRPHALSGHTDWRFEGEGVIPDQCSGSVSALPCVAGNGGV